MALCLLGAVLSLLAFSRLHDGQLGPAIAGKPLAASGGA